MRIIVSKVKGPKKIPKLRTFYAIVNAGTGVCLDQDGWTLHWTLKEAKEHLKTARDNYAAEKMVCLYNIFRLTAVKSTLIKEYQDE